MARKVLLISALAFLVVNLAEANERKNSEQPKADMNFLTDEILAGRKVGTNGEDASALYIKSRLESLGYEATIATFSIKDCWHAHETPVNGKNVLALLKGSGRKSEEVVVISAHFDGVGSSSMTFRPAADDNASGTVALLALAEKLKTRKWNRSILLAYFSGEEAAGCGSTAFSQSVSSDNFRWNINLDMVGRPRTSSLTVMMLTGNDDQSELVSVFQKAVKKTRLKLVLGKDLPEYPPWGWASDHRSFRDVGIPSVMVSDGNGSVIHGPQDVKETINFDYLNEATNLVFEALKRLDKR